MLSCVSLSIQRFLMDGDKRKKKLKKVDIWDQYGDKFPDLWPITGDVADGVTVTEMSPLYTSTALSRQRVTRVQSRDLAVCVS